MKQIRVGILGCGAVAHRRYLKGLSGSKEGYQLVCLCDIRIAHAKDAAQEYGVDHYCSSMEELLEYDLDLVVILTRHDQHDDHARFFLEKGIHVYCEKPFASSSESGEALHQLAKDRGLILGCAPQVMLSSRNQTVKTLLEENYLGKIALVRASGSNLGAAGRKDTDYDPSRFYQEGGSLVSLGIYTLYILIWWFGEPRHISAFSGIGFPKREIMFGPAKGKIIETLAPDNTVSLRGYDDHYISFDSSYCVTSPPEYEFEIHGTKGSLLVGGFGGPESVIHVDYTGEKTLLGPDDDCHIHWNLSWGVEETIMAIREGREPVNASDTALKGIRTLERIFASANNLAYT